MMHWTTRKSIEDHERDRCIAMAALAGYRLTEWCGPGSSCWEVADPKGQCWATSFNTQYAAALAVCRMKGVKF